VRSLKKWKDMKVKEVEVLNGIKAHLTKRTFPEAVENYSKCQRCKHFEQSYCKLDRDTNKERRFLIKLAQGWCNTWDKKPENPLVYKLFTTEELLADTYKVIPRLPSDIDVVVGSSRSGLIPAAALSMALHRPLFSVGRQQRRESTVRPCGSGYRLRSHNNQIIRRILLVEDTVYNGRTLSEDCAAVVKAFPDIPVLKLAIYVHPQVASNVDMYHLIVPGRHYLEWNFFNSISISRCIFDFDGILCEDIAGKDDDDGERYIIALKDAKPKYLIRKEPIPVIATARLEKYREVTEAWLKKWDIRYRKLIMGPWSSPENRNKPMEISKFKAQVFSTYKQNLFVESDPTQAREIAALSGKEVLCPRLKRVIPRGAIRHEL
jgi:orotate phosphoribosyltransferase